MKTIRPIDVMLASRVETNEYQDEKGKYKICEICKGKMYLQDLMAVAKNKIMFLKQWQVKKYCNPCREKRDAAHDERYRKWRDTKVGTERKCKMCHKQFQYKVNSQYYSHCSESCKKEDMAISTLARKMGIDEDALKRYLLDYFEDDKK